MMLTDQGFDGPHRLLHTVLRCRREDHRRIQHLSGRIHHRDLTAGTEGRVPAQHRLSRERRLHQKLPQILTEDLNRPILRLIRQIIPDFGFDGRCDQTLIGIRTGLANIRRGRWMLVCAHLLCHEAEDLLLRHLQSYTEDLLLLTAVQRQHTVSRDLPNRFRIGIVVIIYAVLRRLLLRPRSRYDAALLHTLPADPGTKRGTVRHRLCDDILRALDCRLHIRHFMRYIDIFLRLHRNGCLPLP